MELTVELRPVRKRSGGRIHLTVQPLEDRPVLTLCNRRLPAEEVAVSKQPADCQACLRRRNDPALISSQLFEQGFGEELLARSLERAQSKPRFRIVEASPPASGLPESETGSPPTAESTAALPRVLDTGGASEAVGELEIDGLRHFSENVWVSPKGVTLRMREGSRGWELASLVFDGPVHLVRDQAGRTRLSAGDVEAELGRVEMRVRLRR